MKHQNFFEDPKGVLEEIQRQRQRQLQQEQQQQQRQRQQQLAQQAEQTHHLSTFTATTSSMQSTVSASTTPPSPLAYPSTSSLSSDAQQPLGAANTRRLKPGILRLDVTKPRRSSGGSVEFRNQPQMHGAVSFPLFLPLVFFFFYFVF